MIYFNNDYSEGCLPEILEALRETNMEQTPGYGVDRYCMDAAAQIRFLCKREDVAVHFLVGGTQTNMTVIAASLRPYQGVISAVSGHINVHETGAVEASGHKVLGIPSDDGKITAAQVEAEILSQRNSMDAEHIVQPKMVYISNPTELGTIYRKQELEALSAICHKYGLYLFLDGARLGYGLTADGNDVSMKDLADICDVFYIGGTKVGALFGEAVVITNPEVNQDFRYMIKQRGGMLAKGRLLGVQFGVLMKDDLYFRVSKRANALARKIRSTLDALGYPYLVPNPTNQIFPVLPDSVLDALAEQFAFSEMGRVDESHRAVRICTSWATTEENVDVLCEELKRLSSR